MKQILFIAFVLFFSFAKAQNAKDNASQLDFWVGEWDLYWNDSLKGANIITKEQNNLVIHEHFTDAKNNYKGESWSMYVPKDKKWKQTWVDNSGSYIALEGAFTGKEMMLFSDDVRNGKKLRFRMRFMNITENAFDWEWAKSDDGEKTWKVVWAIQYKRKDKNAPADQAYLQQQFANGKNYFLVLYKKGPEHDGMDSTAVQKIQAGHLQHLFTLHKQRKLNVFGPVIQEGNLLGICIFNAATQDEVKSMVDKDPAIKAQRIVYEILPWFSIKGYGLE